MHALLTYVLQQPQHHRVFRRDVLVKSSGIDVFTSSSTEQNYGRSSVTAGKTSVETHAQWDSESLTVFLEENRKRRSAPTLPSTKGVGKLNHIQY